MPYVAKLSGKKTVIKKFDACFRCKNCRHRLQQPVRTSPKSRKCLCQLHISTSADSKSKCHVARAVKGVVSSTTACMCARVRISYVANVKNDFFCSFFVYTIATLADAKICDLRAFNSWSCTTILRCIFNII